MARQIIKPGTDGTKTTCYMPSVRGAKCDNCDGEWCGHGEKCDRCETVHPDYSMEFCTVTRSLLCADCA